MWLYYRSNECGRAGKQSSANICLHPTKMMMPFPPFFFLLFLFSFSLFFSFFLSGVSSLSLGSASTVYHQFFFWLLPSILFYGFFVFMTFSPAMFFVLFYRLLFLLSVDNTSVLFFLPFSFFFCVDYILGRRWSRRSRRRKKEAVPGWVRALPIFRKYTTIEQTNSVCGIYSDGWFGTY